MSSLQFNVSQLLKSDVGSTRVYDFESDERLDLDDSVAHDIRGRVRFTLTNFGILADVRAHADLDLTCARCLEPFAAPADVAFEEEYQPLIDIATGLPSTAPTTENAFQISRSHTIDLSEALRQHFLLAVEIVPVCRAECRGLCPTCGVNRNYEQCACPTAEAASPFAVLQSLIAGQDAE